MALKDDIAIISRLPLFAGMDEDALRLLAFGAEKKKVDANSILYKEGEAADCAYVLLNGEMVLEKIGSGETVNVTAGSMLSEIAMISEVQRKFTASTTKACEVIRIPRPLFHRLMEEFPSAAHLVHERIQQNLEHMVSALAAEKHRLS